MTTEEENHKRYIKHMDEREWTMADVWMEYHLIQKHANNGRWNGLEQEMWNKMIIAHPCYVMEQTGQDWELSTRMMNGMPHLPKPNRIDQARENLKNINK